MLISVLASGSKGNCTLIKGKNKNILIDIGTNYKYITTKLGEVGLTPSDIDYVLMTHGHGDHTGAVEVFLKHNNPLIFVSRDTYTEIKELHGYDNISFNEGLIELDGVSIESFNTSHDAKGSRGYIIYENDDSFVYITDTGYINQKLFKKLYNHTVYVFESNHDPEMLMHGTYPAWLKKRVSSDVGHLSNMQASFYLSKLIGDKTKEVILAHLSQENNFPELAYNTVKDYLDDLNINVKIDVAKQNERVDAIYD